MPRYIDADDFLELFYVASAGQDRAFVETVEMVIEDTPTADVVEVVRCENCLHSEANSTGYWCKKACYIADAMVTPQHFCGYGERRNDAVD